MAHKELILQHHGVKGMKWGVRKDRVKKPGRGLKSMNESAKRERDWKYQYRERGVLSDNELRDVVNRLRLENEFAKLSGEASKGQRKMAKSFIKNASSIAMNDKTKQAMASVVGAGLRKGMTGGIL